MNDLHAHLVPDADGLGGFAQLATLLREERNAAPDALTLHAGDLVQGTPVSSLYKGLPAFEVGNHLGINVNCLGNHEFDYGWEKVPEFLKSATFDTVSANMVDEKGKRLIERPFVVRETGGVRVAVVGAMMEQLLSTQTRENLGPWRAAPLVETLGPVVEEARQQSDMVIVLGHLKQEDIETILHKLPDVAVVVAGHDHRGMEKALEVDGRVAVEVKAYGKEVGRLKLSYDAKAKRVVSFEWTRIAVDSKKYAADPTVQKLVDNWESKVAATVDVPIGHASRRMAPVELQGLVERVMLERTHADLAYVNPEGIRDFVPAGQLSARNIWNVLPFDNRLVTVQIAGKDLMALKDPTTADGAVARGRKLDEGRSYRLATTDFLTETWSDRGLELRTADQGVLLRDLLIEWFRQGNSGL